MTQNFTVHHYSELKAVGQSHSQGGETINVCVPNTQLTFSTFNQFTVQTQGPNGATHFQPGPSQISQGNQDSPSQICPQDNLLQKDLLRLFPGNSRLSIL